VRWATCLVRGSQTQQGRAENHGSGTAQHLGGGLPNVPAQFPKQELTPEDANEGIRVPKWKSDGQAHVANRKNRQGVGNSPQRASESSPNHQVCSLP